MSAPIQHQTHQTNPSDPGTGADRALSYLRFVSLSEDGTQLRLVDGEGAEHVLTVDDRLRAAVLPRATPAPGRGMEKKKMESTLRPRDIQARIRSGESAEAVAQAAQTSVDKIMVFAAPVLAEREHIADRAQRSSVRRSDGSHAAAGARTLGDAVAAHLRSHKVDPETVEWDAWRREDGRWALVGAYSTGERSGTAELTFDAPGNYVTLDNDDARWLVGELVAPADAPTRPDDLRAARERRLSPAGETAYQDELPLGESLGDDAIDLVSEQPIEAFLDTEAPTDEQVVEQESELRGEAADAAAVEPEPEPEVRRPAKKRGRASVPSWDEIMFGGGSGGPDRP
jgi:Protein of unknown function (DUF3071)